MTIKANMCPYCDAPYTLAYGGCRDNCAKMRRHQQMVQDAIDAQDIIPYDELEAYAKTTR